MYKCTFKCGHMCVQLCHASKCAHAYGGPKLTLGVFLNQSALFIDQILACQLAMVDLLCLPLECCHYTEGTIPVWVLVGSGNLNPGTHTCTIFATPARVLLIKQMPFWKRALLWGQCLWSEAAWLATLCKSLAQRRCLLLPLPSYPAVVLGKPHSSVTLTSWREAGFKGSEYWNGPGLASWLNDYRSSKE